MAIVALFALLTAPAHALNNWEVGETLHNAVTTFSTPSGRCTACHATKSPRTATDVTNAIANVAAMHDLFASDSTKDPLSADQISDIGAYLNNHLTFPLASLAAVSSTTFAPVSVGKTRTLSFRLSNTGTATLTGSSVSLSDTTNFDVNTAACLSVAAGGSCDIQVTFRPQSVATFGSTLSVNGLNTFAGSLSLSLSGEGQEPFDVAPTLLAFTPTTAPTGVLQTTITDRKGDRMQVCRVDATSFNHPEDFSIDAPFALGADNCFTSDTSATTTTTNRTFALQVRFAPPTGVTTPRFAALRVRRVDALGNPLAGTATVTVQLQGNPGAIAAVDASSLFDATGDPGVEVDNDHFIERSFTLTSQGSQPLVFSPTTFTISGAAASDYLALASSGCLARTGLDAAEPPGGVTSCQVTVRFNPSDVGLRDAQLTVQIAGAGSNAVALKGSGFRGPRLVVRRAGLALATDSPIEFGAQTVGGLYPPIGVTLVNGGTQGNLGIVLPAAGALPGFTFVAEPGCASLGPGAQCEVAIGFTPTAAQDFAGHFVIHPSGGTDPLSDFALDLHGQGTTFSVPVLQWTDASGTPIGRVDFPVTDVGSPTQAAVRLRNAGPGGVTLQFANALGPDAASFVLDAGDCNSGRDLFEGTSCQMVVSFAPGTAGAKTASLQFASSAGQPSMLVLPPLLAASGTGRGVAPPGTLQASSTALQFDDTAVGSSAAPLELRLANTGAQDVTVQGLEASAPFSVQSKTCGSLPFVLRPGNECAVSVGFQPQAQGASSGTLRVSSSASAAAMELPLSGNAAAPPDVSGGGCSIASGETPADPTMWVLVLLAALVLLHRRRSRRAIALEGRQER